MSAIKADFHIHTVHSNDSEAPIEDVCRAAVSAGLTAIAVTDHVETAAYISEGFDVSLGESVRAAGRMAEKYEGALRVARGIELGEAVHDLPVAEEILNRFSFDFSLGSIHNLRDEQDFYYLNYASLNNDEIRALLERYFAELLALARWGRFNSLAHINYPMRYIPAERGLSDLSLWRAEIDEILRTAVQNGLAIEINTSGLRRPAMETQPPPCVIRRFYELGGELITIGSDAHKAADVGAGIAAGEQIAREAGFRYAAVFFEGKPEMRSLTI